MKTQSLNAAAEPTLAKPLAPEDVRPGDYVAVLDEEYELPTIVWSCDAGITGRDEVVRIRLRPRDATAPMRVEEVCVPYVFVRKPCGKHETLDLRACRLARLNRGYAKRVCKALRNRARRSKKR